MLFSACFSFYSPLSAFLKGKLFISHDSCCIIVLGLPGSGALPAPTTEPAPLSRISSDLRQRCKVGFHIFTPTGSENHLLQHLGDKGGCPLPLVLYTSFRKHKEEKKKTLNTIGLIRGGKTHLIKENSYSGSLKCGVENISGDHLATQNPWRETHLRRIFSLQV